MAKAIGIVVHEEIIRPIGCMNCSDTSRPNYIQRGIIVQVTNDPEHRKEYSCTIGKDYCNEVVSKKRAEQLMKQRNNF